MARSLESVGPSLPSPSSPFTPTQSVDANSFSSLFATMSDQQSGPQVTSGMTPEQSSMVAAMSSKASQFSESLTQQPSQRSSFSTSTIPSQTAQTSGSSRSASASASNTLAATTTGASGSGTAGSNSTGLSAATPNSSTTASANGLQAQAAMSKPANQAAVAVPVVVVALALIAAVIFCVRRRKKRRTAADEIAEKQPPAGSKNKKWTRHFRVFSFDNELLMGGRYSSSNSIRSRQTGSLRSATPGAVAETPSVHSVEEVAPPYRDAIHHTQPNISQVMTGGIAIGAARGIDRSASTATAPPPYVSGAANIPPPQQTLTTPVSTRSHHNPFADSPPVSPIDDSPFNDPPDTRHSSLYQGSREDLASLNAPSDAASIREATLARNASVRDGGRVIQNVRQSSQ